MQLFSCEICEIFKNTYLEEHLRKTASAQLIPFILSEAWCKSGTRTRDVGTRDRGTRDPPQSLKVGPGTSQGIQVGSPGLQSKFESGIPGPPQSVKIGPYNASSLLYLLYSR